MQLDAGSMITEQKTLQLSWFGSVIMESFRGATACIKRVLKCLAISKFTCVDDIVEGQSPQAWLLHPGSRPGTG